MDELEIRKKCVQMVREVLWSTSYDILNNEKIRQKQKDVEDLLFLFLKDLLEKEGKTPSQIETKESGAYLSVWQIGTKMLKLGRAREKYHIPGSSRRFLLPLVRHNLDMYEIDGTRFPAHLEIVEAVDVHSTITAEELYEVYRELREDGMIWTDAKSANVGRLLRDNKPHFERN